MKTHPVVAVLLLVLLAAICQADLSYGMGATLIDRDERRLDPMPLLEGDVSLWMTDGVTPVGHQAAPNVRVVVVDGLLMKLSITTLNLNNVRRVSFVFPDQLGSKEYYAWLQEVDSHPKMLKLRRQAPDMGVPYPAKPQGGNRYEAWVPTDIFLLNQTVSVVVKVEGKWNEESFRLFGLIKLFGQSRKGRMEDQIQITKVLPPHGIEGMGAEEIWSFLAGPLNPPSAGTVPAAGIQGDQQAGIPAPPYAAPPMPKSTTPTPPPTGGGGIAIHWETEESPAGAPPPHNYSPPTSYQAPRTEQPVAPVLGLELRPQGPYEEVGQGRVSVRRSDLCKFEIRAYFGKTAPGGSSISYKLHRGDEVSEGIAGRDSFTFCFCPRGRNQALAAPESYNLAVWLINGEGIVTHAASITIKVTGR